MRGRLASLPDGSARWSSSARFRGGRDAGLPVAGRRGQQVPARRSQLALRKTQSEVVHGFAHQMMLDYSAAGMKLSQAAADAKLPLRDALDERHKAVLDR